MKTAIRVFLVTVAIFWAAAAAEKSQAVLPPPDGGYPGFNTAEGQNALFSLTAGAVNTAVDWYSLSSNADGSFNTSTGAGALLFNIGNKNTAFGGAALLFNTTAEHNTAVGAAALLNNTIVSTTRPREPSLCLATARALIEFLKEHRRNEEQAATIARQQDEINAHKTELKAHAGQIQKVSARVTGGHAESRLASNDLPENANESESPRLRRE